MSKAPETALEAEIARMIRLEGPITIASYMALCLGHPAHGYYMTRDPFGAAGDFTTAPEISQMFGELIGLWAAEVWRLMGSPGAIRLIELGPGRGTLMADALRATRRVDGFHGAMAVTLVETSPVLRAAQASTLASAPVAVGWVPDLASVPEGPAIIIGNEFLDALPIRQFMRVDGAWRERLVGLDAEGCLAFGLSQAAAAIAAPGQDGDILEVSPAQEFLLADAIAPRLLRHGGVSLFIDYGSAEAGFGDTLQALHRHRKVSPLHRPGESDITAHVPFAALAETARREGLKVHGPTPQGRFLGRLGIGARAEALYRAATDEAGRAGIASAFDRLTGNGADGMGELFKAVAFSAAGLEVLPGFE